MNWSRIAIDRGGLMKILSRAGRPRGGSVGVARVRNAGIAVPLVAFALLAAPTAGAGEYFPAPGFFDDGMTARSSSWDEILTKRGVQVQWPVVGFGNKFVPLSAVCLDGDALAIADPRTDNGVRVSAARFRERARMAMTGGAPARADRLAAVESSQAQPDPQAGPIRYPVNVYKVLPGLTPVHVFLFQKPWEIPPCGAR
jgi:hypothetical protein